MSTATLARDSSPRRRNRTLLAVLLGLAIFMAVWGGWYLSYYGLPDSDSTGRYH